MHIYFSADDVVQTMFARQAAPLIETGLAFASAQRQCGTGICFPPTPSG
jgi:hypothetical protein